MSVPFSKTTSERIKWIQENLNFFDKSDITIEEVRNYQNEEMDRMLGIQRSHLGYLFQ